MPGLQFYIELLESNPKVWRRIVIPYEYTFINFICNTRSFGWENYHLFRFSENGFFDKISYTELTEEINNDSESTQKNAKKQKLNWYLVVIKNLFTYMILELNGHIKSFMKKF
jgi:hypothetical protein